MTLEMRRGEVEWALWALKTQKKHPPPMPSEFGTRVRRLLEIDRGVDFVEAGAAPYAFSADAPGGKGFEAVFSLLDLMMLWLGLELVEMGFKQREVVDQLRFARPLLAKKLRSDLNGRPVGAAPLFLALPGIERSQHAWLRAPRPFLIDAEDLAQRALDGKLAKLVILPVGWQALGFEQALELAPPVRRGRRPAP